MSRDNGKTEPFRQLRWVKPTKKREGWQDSKDRDKPVNTSCDQIRSDNDDKHQVLMVDGTKIVDNHNDILDFEMGQFIWASIDCFAR